MFGLRNNLSQGKTLNQHRVLIAGNVKYYCLLLFFPDPSFSGPRCVWRCPNILMLPTTHQGIKKKNCVKIMDWAKGRQGKKETQC
jgi:hypothetical protein